MWCCLPVALAIGLGACHSNVEQSFPENIQVTRERQAEAIGEFIDVRFDQLEKAEQEFERYVRSVRARERVPLDLFRQGSITLSEAVLSTEQIVKSFPEAAYLTEQDRAFVGRKLAERERRLEDAHTRIAQRITQLGEEDRASGLAITQLRESYMYAQVARDYLTQLGDQRIKEYVGAIHASLMRVDGRELWMALAIRDAEALDRYQTSGLSPTLYYVTAIAPRSVFESDFLPSEQPAKNLVIELLSQELALSSRGVVYTGLDYSGVNDLIGRELRDQLRERLGNIAQSPELSATSPKLETGRSKPKIPQDTPQPTRRSDTAARIKWIEEIATKVSRHWDRPSAAYAGLECEVRVELIPGMVVIGAEIGQCNGDQDVQRSIIRAVQQASPLPRPPEPELFERRVVFVFKPNG